MRREKTKTSRRHAIMSNRKDKRRHATTGKKMVVAAHRPLGGEKTKEKNGRRRRSPRASMRSNIRRAQLDTVPVLKRKAFVTILRLARDYMTEYRDDPKISRAAAEVLVQDLDMYIHRVVTEACNRASLTASVGGSTPTLDAKHIRSVMDDDNFRRSRQACYVPHGA